MKKWTQTIFIFMLVSVILTACGDSSYNSSYSSSGSSNYGYKTENMAMTDDFYESDWDYEEPAMEDGWSNDIAPPGSSSSVKVQNTRKLIKTVDMTLQTKNFDELIRNIVSEVNKAGGYVENSSVSGNSYYGTSSRWANYTVRIPEAKLDEFVSVVGGLGNVTQKNESVEDVTLEYIDTNSRKTALEVEQKRLLELLERAENMEDLLAIESKLSDIRYQIENYGSQLRTLDNQIDYSKVNIDIDEVERMVDIREKTFFEEIAERFDDNLYNVKKFIRNFSIWFLGSTPVFALWIVVVIIGFIIYKALSPILKKKAESSRLENEERIENRRRLREERKSKAKTLQENKTERTNTGNIDDK